MLVTEISVASLEARGHYEARNSKNRAVMAGVGWAQASLLAR